MSLRLLVNLFSWISLETKRPAPRRSTYPGSPSSSPVKKPKESDRHDISTAHFCATEFGNNFYEGVVFLQNIVNLPSKRK